MKTPTEINGNSQQYCPGCKQCSSRGVCAACLERMDGTNSAGHTCDFRGGRLCASCGGAHNEWVYQRRRGRWLDRGDPLTLATKICTARQ